VRGTLGGRLNQAGGRAGDAGKASSRRIMSQATLQLVVRLLNVALGVVAVAVLARSLGAAEFGAWSAVLAYVSLFAFLNDFGFPQVGIQRMAAEPEREAEWLGALAALRTFGALAALVLCVAGIPLFLEPADDVRPLALILSATVLAAAPQAFLAVFTSRLRGGVALAALSLQSIAWTAAVVAIAATDGGILDFAWAFVAVSFAVAAVQVIATRRLATIALRAGRALWAPLFRVALPLGIAGLLVTVYYRINSVLVLNLSGPQEAGYFGAAFRVMDPLHVIPTAVMTAVFPVVAALHGSDRARVKRLVQSGLDFLLIMLLPLAVGSLAVGDQLMTAIFGDGFAPAGDVLPLLLFAFVWVGVSYLPGYLFPVLDLQWWFARLALAGVVVSVGLNLLLIPDHGAEGAAVATLLTETFIAVAGMWAVVRRLEMRLSWSRAARTALASVAMGGVAFALAPVGLVPALAGSAVVYLLALLVLRVFTPAEIRAVAAPGSSKVE
jgi:O-antigen/teichoic acid export membrane protein